MNQNIRAALLQLRAFILFGAFAHADVVKGDMDRAYVALRELLPYLSERESFVASTSSSTVAPLIRSLRDNFHNVESLNSRYQDEPGFSGNLKVLLDSLDDSLKRFEQGQKDYACWKLRKISRATARLHEILRTSPLIPQ